MSRSEQAMELMAGFAERTGLTSGAPPRRYLWTDAFAVANLVGLGETDVAIRLVDQVHHALGRHRKGDARTGWISGLGEAEGEAHPTRGGLRIGKPLPERRADERFDERLEWERDGQYFHYLTRWMHALGQVGRATGDGRYHEWAVELALAAHRGFVHGSPPRMVWKTSIDLSRPLVASMGQHDPLEGLVTCLELDPVRLAAPIADFTAMLDRRALVTDDPLGLGGLLLDAHRLEQLGRQGLADELRAVARLGLAGFLDHFDPDAPAELRVAFRELGLAIGLAAIDLGVARLRTAIESFWLRPDHRRVAGWIEHVDINDVMLATALAPEGVLALRTPVSPSAPMTLPR